MTAAEKMLACPQKTGNPVEKAKLGMHSFGTSGDRRKFRWQYSVTNMPTKRS